MSNPTTEEDIVSSSARIPKAEINGPLGYLFKRLSHKMLGKVPESAEVMWDNRKVLMGMAKLGRKTQTWDEVDQNLKSYSQMAVASFIGCSFCLDYGYFEAHNAGLDMAKASEVPRWRESSVFTPLERDVMEYAEAMSQTPPAVTDEMSAGLLEQRSEEHTSELQSLMRNSYAVFCLK